MYKLLFVFVLVSATKAIRNNLLTTEFEWKYIDYEWNSDIQREWYIQNGLYNYRNVTPLDVDLAQDGRIFVTTIRRQGVPASLNVISNKRDPNGSYLLRPYPDWSWYEHVDPCQGITDVFRIAIDRCNRLWVLDTGSLSSTNLCPAKLLTFDLASNKLLARAELPKTVAQNKQGMGLLVTPIVEVGERCDDYTVFIADTVGFGMLVYRNGRVVRLDGRPFDAELGNVEVSVAGESFHLDDGLMGMALAPAQQPRQSSRLYFRPFSSRSIYATDTDTLWQSIRTGGALPFAKGTDVLASQAAAMAFSSEGALFYGLTRQLAIGCYNYRRPLEPAYFHIPLFDDRLQFVSGVKVKRMSLGHEILILLSNRLQKTMLETRNWNEINFSITTVPVRQLIQGTVCDSV